MTRRRPRDNTKPACGVGARRACGVFELGGRRNTRLPPDGADKTVAMEATQLYHGARPQSKPGPKVVRVAVAERIPSA